jgi:PKD repeat protein
MDSYSRGLIRMRYTGLLLCIICLALVSCAYAGCGIDTNPYDDDPGPLGNGYFPPSADFYGSPLQGYSPLEVTFTDRSTNVPLYWSWSFGDGQSSSVKNPVHIYQSPGIYTVSLVAGNRYGGNSVTKSSYVVVNLPSSPPVVDFVASVTSGYVPLQVEFTDLSTGGIVVSRTWTFNKNGIPVSETTTSQKIVHTFTEPGQYNVTLAVTAANNVTASLEKSHHISVRQQAHEESTVNLHPGWNLVSTPLPLKDQSRTAGQLFVAVDSDSRSFYSYDAGSKQFIPLNSQSEIYPLEGIWVYSKSEFSLMFRYQVTQPVTISMHLPAGWNLIGYPSTEPGNARTGYSSIGTSWSTILCFDPVTQQYSTTIFNEGTGEQSDLQLMNPTNGYWIFMPKEGDLIITIN